MPSMEYSSSVEKENYDDDQFMEHLRFSSSFHPRPSNASDQSNSTSSYHGRPTHHRGSKESYDSQSKRITGGSSYNRNKKFSRTRGSQEGSERCSTDSRRETCDATCLTTSDNVIALFGAYGTTGQYFLQLALEAGYRVRVLVLPGVQLDMPPSKHLTIVTGTFDEEDKIQRVIKKACYIVCMVNDCSKIMEDKEDSVNCSALGFIQRLVGILGESRSNRVLLYQASSVALDDKGTTPILSSLVKKMQVSKTRRGALEEQDKIVQYLCTQMNPESCKYIVTRPSDLIWDKPSRKKLAASKSQPGPFPITNFDLAEFSLNALKTERLYNTCPYVVQDY